MKSTKLNEHRATWNKKLVQEDAFFAEFGGLGEQAYAEGAISKKHKELMGLAISVVVRCDECILSHLQPCLDAGASRQEMMEALKIGLVAGGGVAFPNLRFALEMMEELGVE